jgi:hypothetical protein
MPFSFGDLSTWNFDIDRFLNPFVPPPPWQQIPYPIAHFLGHRKSENKKIGNLVVTFWAFIGIFCAILIIEAASKAVHAFQDHGAPIIIASFVRTTLSIRYNLSFQSLKKVEGIGIGSCEHMLIFLTHQQGASAVLEFYSIESPLAQPRNALFGQFLSSIIGVGVCKLFALSPHFESIRWVGGALACACATAVMGLTKTVHPPAGATALLAVTNDESLLLGWWLVPVMVFGYSLMLGTALLINNIQRKFPMYWWTPEDLHRRRPKVGGDVESKLTTTSSADQRTSTPQSEPQLVVRHGAVLVPEHIQLTPEEQAFLVLLSNRI